MAKHISEVMEKSQSQQFNLKEVLENYKHITLTEDEITEAMIWAKRKKEGEMKLAEVSKSENERRAFLTQKTNTDLVKGLMNARMTSNKLFNKPFVLDENNAMLFELLCFYFGDDKKFESYAANMGIENPSLDKGLFLYGNFGTGKTWMMKLFSRNQRQCFNIVPAKEIAELYRADGEDGIKKFIPVFDAAFEDPSVFFQKKIGLQVDDMGSEDVKNSFGNKRNVIGDLIEAKYFAGTVGSVFHVTTNLTAEQLKSYYGERVTSRMREIFNIITLNGDDRRK